MYRSSSASILICSLLTYTIGSSVSTYGNSPDIKSEEYSPYGEILETEFDIADIRIGSKDADRKGTSTYTAPSGWVILNHEIHREGHHSGISLVEYSQPGRLSYESSAMASLYDQLRQGFLSGKLITKTERTSEESASASIRYAKFIKSFDARYRFVADTHASISFSWFVDSKSFEHGAKLIATAKIKLQRLATVAEAERAAEAIKFAIEHDENTEIFELMEQILGTSSSPQKE